MQDGSQCLQFGSLHFLAYFASRVAGSSYEGSFICWAHYRSLFYHSGLHSTGCRHADSYYVYQEDVGATAVRAPLKLLARPLYCFPTSYASSCSLICCSRPRIAKSELADAPITQLVSSHRKECHCQRSFLMAFGTFCNLSTALNSSLTQRCQPVGT